AQQLLSAGHRDRDRASAGGAFDLQCSELRLDAVLHRLGLLHHLADVHFFSLTSTTSPRKRAIAFWTMGSSCARVEALSRERTCGGTRRAASVRFPSAGGPVTRRIASSRP